MDTVELIVVGLATWQAVEIWHHSPLFADRRSRVETWSGGVKGWLGDLLGCPWCLSIWVAWMLWAGLAAAKLSPWAWPLQAFIAGLAASRLANLGNDLFHASCRTPRDTLNIDIEERKEP